MFNTYMTMIQIRGIPESVAEEYKRRPAQAGQSLQNTCETSSSGTPGSPWLKSWTARDNDWPHQDLRSLTPM
jgi:hypothetical protein